MNKRMAVMIVLTLALQTAFLHLRFVYHNDADVVTAELQMHAATLDGIAGDPYQYRVLIPAFAEMGVRLFPLPYPAALLLLHMMIGAVACMMWVLGAFVWFKQIGGMVSGVMGAGILAGSYAVLGNIPVLIANTPVESALMVWGLIWAYEWFYTPRSQSSPRLTEKPGRRLAWWYSWLAPLAIMTAGVLTVALVRIVQGDAVRTWTIDRVWARNLEVLTEAVLNMLPLLPVLIIGAARLTASGTFIQGLWIVAVVYVSVVGVFGIWNETRLIMPILPILIAPLAVRGLMGYERVEAEPL